MSRRGGLGCAPEGASRLVAMSITCWHCAFDRNRGIR